MLALSFDRFAVVQFIHTGFENLNVMEVMPEDTILVSGKGSNKWPLNQPDTRPSFVKFNRITGNKVYDVLSKYTDAPTGMAVFTSTTGEERLAVSYR